MRKIIIVTGYPTKIMQLIEKVWAKWKNDGLYRLIKSAPGYIHRRISANISKSRIITGRTQVVLRSNQRTLLEYYNPDVFLEIGVAKGDSLKNFLKYCDSDGDLQYIGFDTFDDGLPDEAEEPKVIFRDDYLEERHKKHHKSMKEIRQIAMSHETECDVQLFKGNTKETLKNNIQNLPAVDYAYIDGGHSYETVKNDFEYVQQIMADDGVIVFDDFNGQDGVTEFLGELLQHGGSGYKKSEDGRFDKILFCPPIASANQNIEVIIEL
jgi:hypothetical protein